MNGFGFDMRRMAATQPTATDGCDAATQAAAPLRFGFSALVAGNICLAFGPVFVRLADTGPIASAFWRIALAAVPLFLIARMAGETVRPPSRHWLGVFAISGLFFAADLAAWHIGILETKLANANLLGNSTSFLLPAYAYVASRTWPTRSQTLALTLAVLGAILLMGRSYELSPQNLVGDLLCVLAGAFYTAYLVLMARARATMSPWAVLAWSTLMSAAPLFVAALAYGDVMLGTRWTPLFALALFSQIMGQGLMIYAIGRVPPLLFGITLLIQPVVSASFGWLVYGERLAGIDWIGAGMIAIALILVRNRD